MPMSLFLIFIQARLERMSYSQGLITHLLSASLLMLHLRLAWTVFLVLITDVRDTLFLASSSFRA
jgi:hypothetical protein